MMATLELDPVFVKALSLLRSRSKDSTEQLKALLDEALAGTSRNRPSKASETEGNKKSGTKQREDKIPTPCIKLAASEGSRKEAERRAEKRAGEKQKQSKTDTSDSLDPPQSKKPRSEKPRRPIIDDDDDDNDNVEAESADTEDSSKDDTGDSNHGDSNHGSTDADDFALELGLACIVCKQLDVSAGNQLIECQECHSLYHQLCHKPPASEADPNDPRLVWYCSKCTRNMKKQVTKKLKGSSGTTTIAKDAVQKDVEAKSEQEPVLNLFKRTEPKSTSSSASVSSSSKTPYTGLASLAANLSKPSISIRPIGSTSSSSSRPPSGSSKPGSKVTPIPSPVTKTAPASSSKMQAKAANSGKNVPQTSTASAMKRLQQMKKKASSKR